MAISQKRAISPRINPHPSPPGNQPLINPQSVVGIQPHGNQLKKGNQPKDQPPILPCPAISHLQTHNQWLVINRMAISQKRAISLTTSHLLHGN
jgi:hypothetical protein